MQVFRYGNKKAQGSAWQHRCRKAEVFPEGSKFGLESDSFRRVKSRFCVSEKAVVFLVGLPVFDHSAVPPCK